MDTQTRRVTIGRIRVSTVRNGYVKVDDGA